MKLTIIKNILPIAFLLAGSPAWAAEHWEPTSTTAISITGSVALTGDKITFGDGKSLPLAYAGGLPGFTGGGSKVSAFLYKVTKPADLMLVQGNRLCDGKPVTYIVVWQPRTFGTDAASRELVPFSGPSVPTSDSDPASCGTFVYESK